MHATSNALQIATTPMRRHWGSRMLGLLAVVAAVAATFTMLAEPASARMRDSIWLTANNGTVTATSNVIPPNSYIQIDRFENGLPTGTQRTCSMASTCSTPLVLGNPATVDHVAYVAYIRQDDAFFATSNTLSWAY